LGIGRYGPVHAPNHRVWNTGWYRGWLGALPDVQASHSRCCPSKVSQFRSRPTVSVSSMESETKNPRCYRNQNGSPYSLVPSICRTIDRHNPPRVFGPAAVLDGNGSGVETYCLQRVLQWASNSRWPEGANAG